MHICSSISLATLFGLAVLGAAQFDLHAATADPSRPNILFVYTDDQSFEAVSVVQRNPKNRNPAGWSAPEWFNGCLNG